ALHWEMARSLDLDSPLGVLAAGTLAGLALGVVLATLVVVRSCRGETAQASVRSLGSAALHPALLFPVEGYPIAHLQDTFGDARGKRIHAALDIMAPRRTPVRAVDDRRIARLSRGPLSGIALELVEAGSRYCYYYAHLDGYAAGIEAGQAVMRGQVLGYVGSTGNAAATSPHLHFAVFELDGK